MAEHLAPERRLSGTGTARVLGAWDHGGPAYVALAAGLRRAVLDGSLPLRTRLPGERELADALGVSRTTTAAAYQALRDAGYLVTRRGSGSVTTLPRPSTGGGSLSVGESGPVDLTVAAPAAPPELEAAAARALAELPRHLGGTGYAPHGIDGLREVVARRLTDRGTPTDPDEVLVTSGAQQAISLLVSALVGPGDRVVVEHPTYPNAVGAVRAVGARPVPVPVTTVHGLDLDVLESTVRQSAPRLVYLVPDHHNPTGRSLDGDARARVRVLAQRHRTVVVGDETLTDLTLDGPAPESFAGPRPNGAVVTIGSASKSFWGGLRVGWVRAHRDLVTRLARERARDDMGTAVLDQLVARELLEVAGDVLPARRESLRRRRDALLDAVRRAGLPWDLPVPAGGLSVWAGLGAPVSSALTALALRHGVRVAPGPAFGVDGSFEDRLRLTFALDEESLARGVDGLALAWAALDLDRAPAAPATVTVI